MMRRQRDELITPPRSLRRRQQTQHSEAGPPGFDVRSGLALSGCSNQMLDLSICHPSRPFSKSCAQAFNVCRSDNRAQGNRFSVLAATPPLSAKPSSILREFPVTTSRRTRNSRGTKEAKKRRDMRRNRRKLAAQLLDQQISQAVEETLIKTDFPLPPQPPRKVLLASLSSVHPNDAPLSQPAHLPLTPPELPMPEFSAFDLRSFPSFPATTPLSLRTPSPFRSLPSWCPRIPSLTLEDVWRDSLPTFHDLSGLPEPAEVKPAMKKLGSDLCRDVQIWRSIGSILGREQSKFFPPAKSPPTDEKNDTTARVRLPPVGCWLHRSERDNATSRSPESSHDDSHLPPTHGLTKETGTGLPDDINLSLSSEPSNDSNQPPACTPPSSKMEDGLTSSKTPTRGFVAVDSTPDLNLRHVFPWTQPIEYKANEAWLSSTNSDGLSNRPSLEYQLAQPPYELEGCGVGLPYVHANSLTGFSNESEDTVVHFHNHELPAYADSVVGLPVMHLDDDNVGMNELVVDHDMMGPVDLDIAAGVPLPLWPLITPPATPPSHSIRDIASLMPINCVIEAEHRQSDAHFYSEQALFSQSPVRPTELPRNEQRCGSIDIADFLKLGHAKHCWCDYCNDKSRSPSPDQEDVQWASSPTLTDQTCVDNDSSLSLILNHSESNFDSDSESEAPELLDLFESDANDAESESGKIETAEDEDWLVFSRSSQPSCRPLTSSSPLYLPSSPILHRPRQQRASTPTIIVTTSTDTSDTPVDEHLDEYVAVPPTSGSAAGTQTPVWHEMFPCRPSSAWKNGLAELSGEPVARGPAKAVVEGSWRWGRQSEEEWWDWAVEEEC
jgi:hypothetical protein